MNPMPVFRPSLRDEVESVRAEQERSESYIVDALLWLATKYAESQGKDMFDLLGELPEIIQWAFINGFPEGEFQSELVKRGWVAGDAEPAKEEA